MNGGDFGGGASVNERKILGPRPKKGKDQRDEDLVLFQEMHRQERASSISLLQADSMEFESTGNYQFYRQSSGRKGYEFLTDSGKNDYDWLKTPPATPLFPSLEMEAGINAPEFVVQREIPILQPLSRLSGNLIPSGKSNSVGKSKSPKPNPIPENLLVVPNVNLRPIRTSVTPPETKANRPIRTSVTPIETKANSTKFKNTTASITQKTNPQTSTSSKRVSTTLTRSKVSAKSTNQQQQQQKKLESPNLNFLTSNLSKNMQQELSEQKKSKPRSRGVSPLVRSSINLAGISDETPPNLKTDRSLSATRDRSVNRTRRTETTPLKRENNNLKTQSRSASVSSIRRVEPKQETNKIQTTVVGGNGTQLLGSRMVDRLMNARKSSTTSATVTKTIVGRETRTKPINLRASLNEGSDFGRRMSKSPLDGAFKNMELK